MAVAQDILRKEDDGSITFGNHTLSEKTKVEDFEYQGSMLKVKTYATMTKLEKNGMFVYESEPGTSVNHFVEDTRGVHFTVEAAADAQITVGLEEGAEYEVFLDGFGVGKMKTNMSGKLSVSVECGGKPVDVKITR